MRAKIQLNFLMPSIHMSLLSSVDCQHSLLPRWYLVFLMVMESCQQLVQQCHQCLGFDCFLKTKHQLIGKTWILKDKECIKQKSHNKSECVEELCILLSSLYFEEVWLSCLPMFARVCLFSIHFAVPYLPTTVILSWSGIGFDSEPCPGSMFWWTYNHWLLIHSMRY